ncbi:unnamed protein product [Leptosia nina]|uniref:Neugrin n=1 Tax=Leptosia nina TaxID=320188 RepID=A0AAV1J0N6_9NEOP
MFAFKCRSVFKLCSNITIREIRQRRLPGPNPGLDKRLGAFKREGVKIEDDDAEEFIEQSDSNFYQVGEAYNEHLNETLIGKYELRHQIVKEKYFKENMPNLLTWSEKEQIRHLVNTMPDEWTPQKIAESFPVTEPVVKKLLKFPWKPASEQRIARHDASAMRNWKELREGSLNIPEDLRQHFLKFSERTIPPIQKSSIKVDLSQEERIGEFERIIRRCASKDDNTEKDSVSDNTMDNETNINIEKPKIDKSKMTLEELASKIKSRMEDGQNIEMSDQLIINSVSNVSQPKPKEDNIKLLDQIKEQTDLAEFKADDNKIEAVSGNNYPERIRIPKKAYKKNATYKVNDCYYDHDGKFLYRVIGLTDCK